MRFAARGVAAGGSEAALEPSTGQGRLLQTAAWRPPLPDEEALDFQSALCRLSLKGHFHFNPEKDAHSTAPACPFCPRSHHFPAVRFGSEFSALSSTRFPLNCFLFGLMIFKNVPDFLLSSVLF